METLTLHEHDSLPIVATRSPGQLAISRSQASALARLESRLPAGIFRWGNAAVKFTQYCGVIALGDLSLEILPKLYGQEIEPGSSRTALIRMLHRARRLKPTPGNTAGIALQKHVLLDVFILHFCDQLHAALTQGMIRYYIEQQENLPVLRGRLRVEQQLKLNLGHRERLFCQYDEWSADNLYNQILKSTLQHLSRLALGSQARKQVTELLMRFDPIRNIEVDTSILAGLTFDRSNRRYAPIFEQCRWFIDGFHPDVLAGEASCLTLLFDMNRLFESYVAAECRKLACKHGLRLREQGPQQYLATREDRNQALFLMKPDMTFLDADDRILLLADSKWKLLDERENRLRIAQSDLYQMTSYAASYGVSQLALMYPRQQWLTQPVELKLHGISAHLTVIPVDVTSPQAQLDLPGLEGTL